MLDDPNSVFNHDSSSRVPYLDFNLTKYPVFMSLNGLNKPFGGLDKNLLIVS